MKKSLFFAAAASALMLTACSSENDVVQDATKNTAAVQQQAVGFDVYTQQSTGVTRAGLQGTMTTSRMQLSEDKKGGFGVYAFLTEDADGAGGETGATAYVPTNPTGEGGEANVPNFMVNEKILWNNTNLGWYYNPLKYWPNETDNDSQSTPASMQSANQSEDVDNDRHLDRLTFFAYAPYVPGNDAGGTGITYITDKDGLLNSVKTSDPTIAWKATTDDATFNPNEGVDLLWGVAPSGALSYTAVNGWTVTRNEGTPLLNMIKPNVNTSMKFLFQHALARFGITVVAAVDQVSPGGKLDPNTKITIDKVKITGKFGTIGELNLNNDGHPSVANWTKIQNVAISDATTASDLTEQSIIVTANDATEDNNAIAKNLRWTGPHNPAVIQPVVGVTPAKQDLLAPSKKWFTKLASIPAYNPAKQYYDVNGDPVSATYKTTKKGEVYELSGGKYVAVDAGIDIDAPVYPNYNKDGESTYYRVTEDKTYPANYPNGENSYSPVRYKFESYGDDGCTNKYGEGIVEVAGVGTSKTRVIVLENNPTDPNAANFVGQDFWVDGKSFTPNATYRLQKPSGTQQDIWVKVIQEVKYGYNDEHLAPTEVLYKKNGTGTDVWYEYAGTKNEIDWDKNTNTYVTLNESKINVNDFNYAYAPGVDYYEAERNYLYVVPTNNVWEQNANLGKNPTDLRTITVQIEYYITTEDDKLAAKRAQTKNVITKEVVLPSLANGKSYNLNMVLGLTSVKIEAEVDDWKVENVQADLPQNTGE